ncbi:UTRA domain-containing protein [Egibacter rhizosphaerae]|nr:UTRA domain-containing protein [Egibacter rhizosphaerae]
MTEELEARSEPGPADEVLIDRESPIPLYHQLERRLRDEFESGRLSPGDKLPSEGELADRYSVARSVVRQALSSLASAGLIYTQRGRGSFVAERKFHGRFVPSPTGLHDELTAAGLEMRTRVLRQERVKTLPVDVQEFLGATGGFRVDRLRTVNGKPLSVVTTYVAEDRMPGLEQQDLEDKSLYAFAEQEYGLRVAHGSRTVEAVPADPVLAELLEVEEGASLLLLRSATYAEDGDPFEWFDAWHRGDRTAFEIDISPSRGMRPVPDRVFEARPSGPPRATTPHDDQERGEPEPTAVPPTAWAELVTEAFASAPVVAVLRAPVYGDPQALAEGLRDGGVRVVEFTLTGANALEAIDQAREVEGVVVGAGTVVTREEARKAVAGGAEFLVAPANVPEIVDAVDGRVPVVLAGFTPSELLRSWQATRAAVKLFPAGVLGPSYLKDLAGPLPYVPIMPSGGIDATNAADYLAAGAHAVNVGTALSPVDAVERGDGAELLRRTQDLVRTLPDTEAA